MSPARHMASGALSAGEAVKARVPNRSMTAFVLSGGASLGALQVGMLRPCFPSRTCPPRFPEVMSVEVV